MFARPEDSVAFDKVRPKNVILFFYTQGISIVIIKTFSETIRWISEYRLTYRDYKISQRNKTIRKANNWSYDENVKVKSNIFKAIIRPIMTYTSVTGPDTAKTLNA